mgnify:CR=1 FL=1
MLISNIIENGAKILKQKNIKSYNLDSEILLSLITKKEKEYLIINDQIEINKYNYLKYLKLILRKKKKEPVAYIINKKEFWSKDFFVDESVLIPRPDTEVILEDIKRRFNKESNLHILDVGTGSGCILFSILKEFKNFRGIGIDKSKKAIKIAKYNSKIMNISKRVKLIHCDVDNYKFGKYDLIISNPPYIKKIDLKYLDKDVINFEPKLALDGGLEGLSAIRKVINKSSELIKINGKLVIEIAFDQKNEVVKLLKNKGFYINKVLKDLAKNDRCIISTKNH